MLAARLVEKYRYENCSVVALDDGGVVVGSEISAQLHCALNMTVSEEISLPREPWAVGNITADGQFVPNSQYTESDIAYMESENRGYLEEQKIEKFHSVNRLLGAGATVDRKTLSGRNIILASDGLDSTYKLDGALAFLKIISYQKIIVATPIASVQVVDWMHVHADEIFCLSVLEDYMNTDHYYDIKDVPEHDNIQKALHASILNWK